MGSIPRKKTPSEGLCWPEREALRLRIGSWATSWLRPRLAAEREGLHVAVSVADEGRGIAPAQLGQLFRKYTAAGDREGGIGSGLGLAICKGLVEAQGGRIRAESGGGGLGARFTFTIPVAAESGAGARTGRGAHPGG